MSNIQSTLNEREKTHGSFNDQGHFSQALKDFLRFQEYEWAMLSLVQREALEVICMKISRIIYGNQNEPDHWKDIAGYATLIENILTKEKQ